MPGARLVAVLVLAGCGAGERESRALHELERLSFVPPASCSLPNQDLSLARAIVIDRMEFTRADLRHYWPERAPRASQFTWPRDSAAQDGPERADWPAFVDYHEAEELAALRGMRLPTPIEWLHVAVGRRDYQSPWGGPGREFFANTVVVDQEGVDFSLKTPSNVGTYENGKSRPFGCYDLLGNVWEWVDGVVPGYGPGLEADERDDDLGTMTSILGGAYDTVWRPTFQLDRATNRQRFHARRVHKSELSPSVGVRMCADAASYLWEMAPRWGTDAGARERVRDVGRTWAENDALARAELTRLLAELRARPGAAPALAWLEAGVLAEP